MIDACTLGELGACRFQRGAWRQPAEQLCHAVPAVGHHRRPEMVRARHDVRDELGLLRIGHGGFEDADDGRDAWTETDCLPITVGSLWSTVVQNRCVSTTAPAAPGPSSAAFNRRPSTGRSPMTSKNDPLTTPAFTTRGSLPKPINVKSTVEKSPNAAIVVTRDLRSLISGTEKVRFSVPMPGAVWRI